MQLSSFWGAMLPQKLQAQDSGLGPGVSHSVHLQTSSGCVHQCQQVALALVGLQLCDVTDLPGCPMFVFQPLLTIPERLSLLALLDGSTCFTVMGS